MIVANNIENYISYNIRGAIFDVYNNLGPGLLESVYEEALICELKERKLKVEQQKQIPILYKNKPLKNNLRLDLLIEDRVIVEIKSVAELQDVHFKQLDTYLKLTGLKLGILVNFNTTELENNIIRRVNKL